MLGVAVVTDPTASLLSRGCKAPVSFGYKAGPTAPRGKKEVKSCLSLELRTGENQVFIRVKMSLYSTL
jgi:hypothetical protein